MTRRRVPLVGLAPGPRALDADGAHYVCNVLRLRVGDIVEVFDPASGHVAEAVLTQTDPAVILAVGPLSVSAGRVGLEIVWIQGLAKSDKVDAVVRDATELGATRVVVAVTRHTVVRLERARATQRVARWERIAREAARQSGRVHAPVVAEPCAWVDALASVPDDHARFCLWERATEPLKARLAEALAVGRPLAFACGPEGGLDDDEAAVARESGWQVVSLGPRVLRTETVAAAVLGAVEIWRAAW